MARCFASYVVNSSCTYIIAIAINNKLFNRHSVLVLLPEALLQLVRPWPYHSEFFFVLLCVE